MPLALHRTLSSPGPRLRLRIADDFAAARSEGCPATGTLTLQFEALDQGDRLAVALNGTPLPWGSSRLSSEGWSRQARSPTAEHGTTPSQPVEVHQPGVCVEYEVGSPPLRHGENELEVQLVSDRGLADPSALLTGVEVTVSYPKSSGAARA